RGPGLRAASPHRHAAGRRLSPRRRHARAHHGGHRGAARRAHRVRGRAGVRVAARGVAAGVAVAVGRGVGDLPLGYPGKPVGEGVSFTVEPGEVLCLLGPNGGGKTTLFKTVLSLLAPRAGTVRVDGESVAGWGRPRLARTFGYVPQAQLTGFPFTV